VFTIVYFLSVGGHSPERVKEECKKFGKVLANSYRLYRDSEWSEIIQILHIDVKIGICLSILYMFSFLR
jgi:hypothetical protein